ncbi:MAG: Ig-like domain-containing protein, partial [Coriobacteriia bacterium]|nr:Ig-like domain-containing protein [Coriobacteriia bacterium]
TYVRRASYAGFENERYQDAYRLKGSGGGEPMDIPRTDGGMPGSDFALCLECHEAAIYLDRYDLRTNFRSDPTTLNSHWYHLQGGGGFNNRWDSDWDGIGVPDTWGGDSTTSCPACHNVHGSQSPAMVRRGELISTPGTTDKVPSLGLRYWPGTYPTLFDSQGGVTRFIGPYPGAVYKNGICSMCHNDTYTYTRTPSDIYPPRFCGAYGEAGSPTVTVTFSEGVYGSIGGVGDLVPSDFSLTDVDDGRSITGVAHSAGDPLAYLILSSALDASDDVGVDLVSAATTASVYDLAGQAMTTATVTISGDTTPPSISQPTPTSGATDVAVNVGLALTVSDTGIGVDPTTLQVELTGSKGYSQTYTAADPSVEATGAPAAYRVRVTPEAMFGYDEDVTVTVSVDDLAGNTEVFSEWSFTTAPGVHWQTPEACVDTSGMPDAGILIDGDAATGLGFCPGPLHSADFLLDEGGDMYAVDSVRIYGGPHVRTWTAYVSTDAVTWTSVTSGWSVGGASGWYEYELPTPKTTRYLRAFYFCPGPAPADVAFEFEFRGVAVPDTYTAPSLDWTGETGYVDDGVDPDGAIAGDPVEFRVDYTDEDGQMPETIEVWVDIDDSGSYEASETFAMAEASAADTDTTDGKRYTRAVTIPDVGDGLIDYRFHAADPVRATGPPVDGGSLVVAHDPTLDVPAEYPTLQAAIDAAVDGWTVRAADGTYPENITFRGKAITVESQNGAASTTIEGTTTANQPVVLFGSGETTASVLDGFTIDNAGYSSATRGILIGNSRPTIRDCVVKGNQLTSSRHGAGFYIDGTGGAVIEDCVIGGDPAAPNEGMNGVAIYWVTGTGDDLEIRRTIISHNNGANGALLGAYSTAGALTVEESTITANTMTGYGGGVYLNDVSAPARFTDTYIGDNSASGYGGGAYLRDSSTVFSGCDITSNTAAYDGGGLRITGASAATTITGGTISENTGRGGGGFDLDHSSGTLRIDGTAITGNVASVNYGGAMRLSYVTDPPLVTNTSIEGNQAAAFGGGAFISNGSALTLDDCALDGNTALGWGGGAYVASASTFRIVDCTIDGNRAGSGNDDGGGLYVSGSRLDILRTYIRGNITGRYGGGLLVRASSEATLTNCTISGNAANGGSGSRGGGIYSSSTTTTITNCTISGNYASQWGGGIISDSGTMLVRNCIVYGNDDVSGPSEIVGAPTVEYSDVRGGFLGTGNIDAAPSYVATVSASVAPTSTGDYHLRQTSPCEGTGTSGGAPPDDIDGEARPQGTGHDMGSDEITGASPMSMSSSTIGEPLTKGSKKDSSPSSTSDSPDSSKKTPKTKPGEVSIASSTSSGTGPDTEPVSPAVPLAVTAAAVAAARKLLRM